MGDSEKSTLDSIREDLRTIEDGNGNEAQKSGLRDWLLGGKKPAPVKPKEDFEEDLKTKDFDRRKALLNKKVSGFRNRLFPARVRVAWFERNFTALTVKDFDWMHDGVVVDKYWGRAAEIGPDICPIEIGINRDARLGFMIDGDKGVAVMPSRSEGLRKLETTSELAWVTVDSARMANTYQDASTNRSKILVGIAMFALGIIFGMGF